MWKQSLVLFLFLCAGCEKAHDHLIVAPSRDGLAKFVSEHPGHEKIELLRFAVDFTEAVEEPTLDRITALLSDYEYPKYSRLHAAMARERERLGVPIADQIFAHDKVRPDPIDRLLLRAVDSSRPDLCARPMALRVMVETPDDIEYRSRQVRMFVRRWLDPVGIEVVEPSQNTHSDDPRSIELAMNVRIEGKWLSAQYSTSSGQTETAKTGAVVSGEVVIGRSDDSPLMTAFQGRKNVEHGYKRLGMLTTSRLGISDWQAALHHSEVGALLGEFVDSECGTNALIAAYLLSHRAEIEVDKFIEIAIRNPAVSLLYIASNWKQSNYTLLPSIDHPSVPTIAMWINERTYRNRTLTSFLEEIGKLDSSSSE